MRRLGMALLAVVALAPSTASADPVVLRLASVAPEGTAFARELRAFGREIEATTRGNVQVKWYLGGIAGDELQSHERVQRDQLDGIMSGGMLCQRLAPSMRATGMAAEFHDRAEVAYVMSRLKPLVDSEMAKIGYVDVGHAAIGFSVFFSRQPLRTMADLRNARPWLWSLDDVLKTQLSAMGIPVVPLTLEQSTHAFDDGRIDSFVGLPSAALAFQWSTQARYVMDLRVGFLTGCLLVSRRSWDTLPHEDQQLVSSATAKLAARIEDMTRQTDDMLLGRLFAKQGLQALPVSAALQAEFVAAAKEAQKQAEKLAPAATVERVAAWLDEYRASHKK
jgi:TRAP-type transport system periplasmic protein